MYERIKIAFVVLSYSSALIEKLNSLDTHFASLGFDTLYEKKFGTNSLVDENYLFFKAPESMTRLLAETFCSTNQAQFFTPAIDMDLERIFGHFDMKQAWVNIKKGAETGQLIDFNSGVAPTLAGKKYVIDMPTNILSNLDSTHHFFLDSKTEAAKFQYTVVPDSSVKPVLCYQNLEFPEQTASINMLNDFKALFHERILHLKTKQSSEQTKFQAMLTNIPITTNDSFTRTLRLGNDWLQKISHVENNLLEYKEQMKQLKNMEQFLGTAARIDFELNRFSEMLEQPLKILTEPGSLFPVTKLDFEAPSSYNTKIEVDSENIYITFYDLLQGWDKLVKGTPLEQISSVEFTIGLTSLFSFTVIIVELFLKIYFTLERFIRVIRTRLTRQEATASATSGTGKPIRTAPEAKPFVVRQVAIEKPPPQVTVIREKVKQKCTACEKRKKEVLPMSLRQVKSKPPPSCSDVPLTMYPTDTDSDN